MRKHERKAVGKYGYDQANDKGFLHEAECERLQKNIDHVRKPERAVVSLVLLNSHALEQTGMQDRIEWSAGI